MRNACYKWTEEHNVRCGGIFPALFLDAVAEVVGPKETFITLKNAGSSHPIKSVFDHGCFTVAPPAGR